MKLKKIRNALLVVLTLALVSATTVAITWAAKTKVELADDKTNEFTNNPNIGLQFRELTFDTLPFGTDRTDSDGNVPKSGNLTDDQKQTLPDGSQITTAAGLGYNMARSYAADDYIPKNPQLRNSTNTQTASDGTSPFDTNNVLNGSTSNEWVALGVKYTLKIPATVYKKSDNNAAHDGSAADDEHAISVTQVSAGNSNTTYAGDTVTFDNYTDFTTAIATVGYCPSDEALSASTTGIRAGTTEGSETWKDISTDTKGTLYMYNKIVPQNGVTTTLFDTVHINNVAQKFVNTGSGVLKLYELTITAKTSAATDNQLDREVIYVSTLPQFEIDLKGYAIQADNVSYADAPATIRDFVASFN